MEISKTTLEKIIDDYNKEIMTLIDIYCLLGLKINKREFENNLYDLIKKDFIKHYFKNYKKEVIK